MFTTPLSRGSIAAALLCTVLLMSGAQAAPQKASKPAKPAASSVKFIEAPSAEKPAAREKRLKRECKGRPNAGLCLGHTR
jgi:hypothetical protein